MRAGLYLAVLWSAANAWAQPIFPLPTAYEQCTELAVPGAPAPGQQLRYCKAGVGLCTKDSAGVEFCPGGGGGSPTFTAIQSGTNTTAAMVVGTGASMTLNTTTNLFTSTLATGTTNLFSFSPSATLGNSSIRGLNYVPTLTYNADPGNQALLRWGGTITATANPSAFSFMNLGLADYTSKSTTNGVAPWFPDTIMEVWVGQLDGAITATGTQPIGHLWLPGLQALNGATLTVPYSAGLTGGMAFTANGAGSQLNSTRMDLVRFTPGTMSEVGGGVVNVDNISALHAEDGTKHANTEVLAIIDSALTAGTGKYFLRDSGGAQSVISGDVRIGDTTSPTTADGLEVVGIVKPRVSVTDNPGTTQAIEYQPSYTLSSGTNAVRTFFSSPTVTYNGGTSQSTTTLTGSPTINVSANPSTQQGININSAPAINFNAASAATNFTGTAYRDAANYQAANVAAGSTGLISSFHALPTLRSTGASGTVTFPNVYGYRSEPVLTTNNASGTATITNMRHFVAKGVAMSGAGTETTTTEIGLDIQTLTGTTQISIQQAGTIATMRHEGFVGIGPPVSSAPAVQLEVQTPTVGSEIVRIDSVPVAGADSPTEQTFQCDLQTTDATQTDCKTIAVTSGKVRTVEAMVVAHCTAGASCTANNGAGYKVSATCKNNAGTTQIIGAATAIATHEDVGTWDATIDCDNTGDTARLRLTGAATTTILWHATIRTMQVGS